MKPSQSGSMDDGIHIEISRDHFKAYLHVKLGCRPSVEEIMHRLEKEKIVYGIKDWEKISIFLENLELYDYTLIVSTGKPFTHGKNAEIQYHFETDQRTELEDMFNNELKLDFRKVGNLASVRRGDVIATKIPAEQGKEGITVFGQKLPGEWGMDIEVKPGANVKFVQETLEFIAMADGAPIVSRGQIRVDPVYIIEGDVDYATGNIAFDGTVVIKGSVLDGFNVSAGGDIVIENTIQCSHVDAKGDIIVKRGILTRGKGLVAAEGNIYAKFIENSTVECEGNIIVETSIINSRVRCNGRVMAVQEGGSVIGGSMLVFDRLICRNLGSVSHSTTIVQAGYRFDIQHQYLEALGKLRAVQNEIKEIQKLYEYACKKDPEDLDKLGEVRGKMIKLVRLKDQMKEDIYEINATRIFNQFAMVETEYTVYPGVTVLIGDSRYNINKETKYASFKWDDEHRTMYLSSFDESGRGIRKEGAARGKSVLIIDDSKSVRKTLRMILERMGLRVVDEAEDGLEGVEKYKQYRPTLVTCDIMMVNLNGLETLQAIRKVNSRARVIMISSIRDRTKVIDCVMAGAKDYVLKPFIPGRVIDVVKTVLES